jgi:hypothetical protein
MVHLASRNLRQGPWPRALGPQGTKVSVGTCHTIVCLAWHSRGHYQIICNQANTIQWLLQ